MSEIERFAEHLRERVALCEALILELAARCWQEAGTRCASDFAKRIDELLGFKNESDTRRNDTEA